jgi:hypothetical protein
MATGSQNEARYDRDGTLILDSSNLYGRGDNRFRSSGFALNVYLA